MKWLRRLLQRETPLEWCRRLADKGMTNHEIAEATRIDYLQVKEMLRNWRRRQDESQSAAS